MPSPDGEPLDAGPGPLANTPVNRPSQSRGDGPRLLEALFAEQPISEATSREVWPGVHERCAKRYGLDPEIGRRAYPQHAPT